MCNCVLNVTTGIAVCVTVFILGIECDLLVCILGIATGCVTVY